MYSYTFGYIVRQMVNLRFPILSSLATPLPPDPPVSKSESVSSGVPYPFHYPHFPCDSDAFGQQMSQSPICPTSDRPHLFTQQVMHLLLDHGVPTCLPTRYLPAL
jgi:hypothetical protein